MFREAVSISPDNDNDLEEIAQAIYVGGAGHITVHMVRQEDPETPVAVTFNNVSAGTTLPIFVKRVLAAGTTATNLLALRS